MITLLQLRFEKVSPVTFMQKWLPGKTCLLYVRFYDKGAPTFAFYGSSLEELYTICESLLSHPNTDFEGTKESATRWP